MFFTDLTPACLALGDAEYSILNTQSKTNLLIFSACNSSKRISIQSFIGRPSHLRNLIQIAPFLAEKRNLYILLHIMNIKFRASPFKISKVSIRKFKEFSTMVAVPENDHKVTLTHVGHSDPRLLKQ